MSELLDAKLALRREMRAMRRALPDAADRSRRIWELVQAMPEVADAGVVMAFASIHGEPDTGPFIEWCRAHGKTVVLPEDEPMPDPSGVDVVIVPGTAFTADGHRLGQGGGWYDRFLVRLAPATLTIGVGFAPQLVDDVPIEEHDVRLGAVVTDAGVIRPEPAPRTR